MSKRGQATIFVVIAILIIVIVLLVIFLVPKINVSQVSLPDGTKAYITDTVNFESETTVIAAGLHGGKIPPRPSFSTDYGLVSYWLLDGDSYFPTTNEIEKDMNLFLENNLRYKLNFSDKQFSWETTIEDININSSILQDQILITTDLAILLKKGSQSARIKESRTNTYDVSLLEMLNTGEMIVQNYAQETLQPEDVGNFELQILNFNETKVFVLTDKTKQIGDMNYTLMFAAK
jgi:hypothetical protein